MSVLSDVMSGRTWTPEQAEAIERRQGDLLLEAGAGSGKTSVLVERFARHVLEDGIAVGAILAITFTEKAAAELRDRIRTRLGEAGEPGLARATEDAHISTIHGFCARLLRAHALAAGLDPEFVVLDRDRSNPLAAAAFDEALSALEREAAVELVSAYGAGALRSTILPVYAQLRSKGQLAPRLPELPPPPPQAGRQERLARALEALVDELGQVAEPGAQVLRALDRLGRCRELLEVAELWPAELDPVKLPGNGAALSTDACTEYRDALSEFRAACAARAAGPLRDHLDELLRSYGERYTARKREVSGLDFEDLELLALELLRGRPELRERYATRFERIMVDELQDTNRVQLDLIEAIARQNLFTVGDAQQSIYRFRHADVSLFERRGARLAEVDGRRTLQTNFRSRPEILETLNHGFANELQERFTPLLAGREPVAGEEDPRVELLLVDKGADWELEGRASPWRLAEAQALAGRVAELVRSGTPPGEVVVLMRATADMRVYERALEQRGLPTYVIGGRGYWSHPQVVDLIAYLQVLANPLEDEFLYTVLTSPLVGVSLDALVILGAAARSAEAAPWSTLRGGVEHLERLGPDDREALRRFTDWFATERAGLAHRTIEELIERVLELTSYDLAMLSLPGGRRRLANVRKLMRLGREYEREHGPDLRGFLAAVADRASGLAADTRESEAPVEGEGLDAIRLMTIHRAKGLEWPTVCVADLGRSPRPPSPVVRIGPGGRLGLRLSRAGVGDRVLTPEYETLYHEERDAEAEEERRLFYVAMTRAQERLILSGAARLNGWTGASRSTGGGPVAWIAPALVSELGRVIGEGGDTVAAGRGRVTVRVAGPQETSLPVEGGSSEPPGAQVGQAAPRFEPAIRAADRLERGPRVPTVSYSSLALYARCGYRFYAERVVGLAPTPGTGSVPGLPGALNAAERGVLLHALLERLRFRRPVAPTVPAVLAAARGAGVPAPAEQEAVQLAAVLARFASSQLCARLGRALDARREQPFTFPLGELLVTGVLDVLAREPGRLLVVDYKSDRLKDDPAAVVERDYGTQQLVYALAALHAGAERVEVVHCFLEVPDSPVVAEFARDDRERLQASLERLASGLRRGEFAVAPDPQRSLCAGCPAEGGLCSWPLPMTRRSTVDRLF